MDVPLKMVVHDEAAFGCCQQCRGQSGGQQQDRSAQDQGAAGLVSCRWTRINRIGQGKHAVKSKVGGQLVQLDELGVSATCRSTSLYRKRSLYYIAHITSAA